MTDAAPPIRFRFEGDGEFKAVSPAWARASDRHYVIGETYELVEHLERSSASHRHFFAMVRDAWTNLPDHLAKQLPSPEHLRKYALIKAGFCDSHTYVCGSKAEVQRLKAALTPLDEFGIVTDQAFTVTRYTAKSQSYRHMGREDFKRSKDEVLRIVAELIGTTAGALHESAAA